MAGYILRGILLLLAFLLLCPVEIHLRYRDKQPTMRLRLLGVLTLTLWPQKPQKPKRPKKIKPKPAKPTKTKKPKPKKEPAPLMDTLGIVGDLLPQVGRLLGFTLRHTTIKKLRLRMTVEGEDAAQTAIQYGQLNVVFYNFYTWLAAVTRLREYKIALIPNFTGQPEELFFAITLKVSPGVLLWGGLRLALVVFKKFIIEPKQKEKDGVPLWHKPQSVT